MTLSHTCHIQVPFLSCSFHVQVLDLLQVYNMQVTHCFLTYHKTCHIRLHICHIQVLDLSTKLITDWSHKGHIQLLDLLHTYHIQVTYLSHTGHIFQVLDLLQSCHILFMYLSHTGHILVTYNFCTCWKLVTYL